MQYTKKMKPRLLFTAVVLYGTLISANQAMQLKTMNTLENPKQIIGYSIRTSNAEAPQSIPAHWGKFMSTGAGQKIPDSVSDTLYAVYTRFENEGQNNEGIYTFLIGKEVSSGATVPEDMELVELAAGDYHVFPVADNKPENVFETWMQIWSTPDLANAYVSDFEEYKSDGTIAVNVGTVK